MNQLIFRIEHKKSKIGPLFLGTVGKNWSDSR